MSGVNSIVSASGVEFSNSKPFSLMAGPCAMESKEHALHMAGNLKEICSELRIGFVYKTSFDKANRTSIGADRGVGLDGAKQVFDAVKAEFGLPIVTDVHTAEQCVEIAPHVDILQIPAFLCRQTDLLVAAAKTGKVVNIKKGQFLAPWDMVNVLAKVTESGNPNVLLTDRGTSFGYNTLVTDFRGLPTMAETGAPVVFDATHSVQQPGGKGGSSGGQREFVPVLSRAAVAVGVAGLFIETHQEPEKAPSDGPNMVPLDKMKGLLENLKAIDEVAKANPFSL